METSANRIKLWHDITEDAAAARFLGVKVALLRKAAKELGPGVRMTGKAGRTATFLGKHPDPDYWGAFWWRIEKDGSEMTMPTPLSPVCGSRSTEPALNGFIEGEGGSTPFVHCDDVHDAANDAISGIEARLAIRGMQLAPGCADAIKSSLVATLEGAEVEGIYY
jgi:hypothetical protein